jgi:hypothetical protein
VLHDDIEHANAAVILRDPAFQSPVALREAELVIVVAPAERLSAAWYCQERN